MSIFRGKFRLGLIGLILLVIGLSVVAGVRLAAAQAAPSPVGVSTAGQNAYEFIGRIDQTGPNFTGHGYLTYIRGLNNNQIFSSNPVNQSEDTARFTYVATATLTSRAILSDVFVINSVGTITFYFTPSPPNRTFGNLNSFAAGTPIATASMRYQDILLVQSANKGLATGLGEVTQLSVTPFNLSGQSYRFGASHLIYRYSTVGNGTRTNPDPNFPESFVLLAGNAVTTGQTTFLPSVSQNSP